MTDFIVEDHGSIVLLTTVTDEASEWADNKLSHAGRSEWCGAIVIGHQYIGPILDGVKEDGLSFTIR